jgi:colanic acid/amylovoran biosynthesis protein
MNILIINLHSARNLGDDAIMYETMAGLKKAFPSAHITLSATDSESWLKYCKDQSIEVVDSLSAWAVYLKNGRWHIRLSAVFIYFPLLFLAALLYRFLQIEFLFGSQEKRRLLSAYYNADLVLGCGGGNLYAHFWISPFFLLSLMALGIAVALGKRVILLPQSIGPIRGGPQKWLARNILNRVDKIMVREPRSLEFVQKVLRLERPPILIPDLAFAPLPQDFSASLKDLQPCLKIGVTVIDRASQTRKKAFTTTKQEAYERSLISALVKISQKYGAMVYLFSQCTGPDLAHDDRQVLNRIYLGLYERGVPAVLFDAFDDYLELKAAYACMDCIIGSRMHTAIFALSLGVPVILIGYQPKAAGVMELFGLSQFCYEIEAVDEERLVAGLAELLENREEFRRAILKMYSEIQIWSQRWIYEIAQ